MPDPDNLSKWDDDDSMEQAYPMYRVLSNGKQPDGDRDAFTAFMYPPPPLFVWLLFAKTRGTT